MREAPEFVRGARICARVVSAAGPWRRQGEWWTSDSLSSDPLSLSLSLSRERVGVRGPYPTPIEQSQVRAVSTNAASRNGSSNGHPRTDSWHANTPLSYARDYYELALADGGVYRVYCDLYSGKWFVDGIYD